jgi:hypothetical protein
MMMITFDILAKKLGQGILAFFYGKGISNRSGSRIVVVIVGRRKNRRRHHGHLSLVCLFASFMSVYVIVEVVSRR